VSLWSVSIGSYHHRVVTPDIDLSSGTRIEVPADVNQFTADISSAHGSWCRVLPNCYMPVVFEVFAYVLYAKFDGLTFMITDRFIWATYQQSNLHIGLSQFLQELPSG
jgi:hypothetical protein